MSSQDLQYHFLQRFLCLLVKLTLSEKGSRTIAPLGNIFSFGNHFNLAMLLKFHCSAFLWVALFCMIHCNFHSLHLYLKLSNIKIIAMVIFKIFSNHPRISNMFTNFPIVIVGHSQNKGIYFFYIQIIIG